MRIFAALALLAALVALNGSIVLIGLLAVARIFDPVTGTRVLLLSPLVLAADMTIGTLQIGNLQAAVFSVAMLAMAFFAQRRYAAGGVLFRSCDQGR